MRVKAVIVLGTILLMAGLVHGQAKVGTTGAQFLEISPSVRTNGMGHTGVAFADEQSWYLNPALPGIAGLDDRLMLSPYMWTEEGNLGYSSAGFTIGFPLHADELSRQHSLAVGYHYTHFDSDPIAEIDYFGNPTGDTFWWEDYAHHLTVSYASRGKVEFAAGVNAKYIRETVQDFDADGGAVDLGLYLGRPITLLSEKGTHHLKPSVAAAIANWGPDLNMIRDDYPLPHIWRFGLAMEWGYDQPGAYQQWERLRLGWGLDFDRYYGGIWYTCTGLESRLFEAVAIRVGGTWGNDRANATWGFGLHLSGLTKSIIALIGDPQQPGKLGRFLINQVSVSYSEAHGDTAFQFDSNRALVLTVPMN